MPAAPPVHADGADWVASRARLLLRIEQSGELSALVRAAAAIPALAGRALDGGVAVGPITASISALNDALNVAAVRLAAAAEGVDLGRCCWLVFGSQGRGEQTIATDQDNGLVFDSVAPDRDRPRWLAFGQRVNLMLAQCGCPLCSGSVMAGQAPCCLSVAEWAARFEHWIAHGSGNDLFGARLYFDLRPLVGRLDLAAPLQALLCSPAAAVPRFLKQMADSVLAHPLRLNWLGRIVTTRHEGRAWFDLKLGGTALFVDAARLWALALGLAHTGTEARLRAAAPALRVQPRELDDWVRAFHALQQLRLQVQRGRDDDDDPEQRCLAPWDELSPQQRAELERALRAARWLRRRIELDYRR